MASDLDINIWMKYLFRFLQHLQVMLLCTVTAINLCNQLFAKLALLLVEVTLLDPECRLFVTEFMLDYMLNFEKPTNVFLKFIGLCLDIADFIAFFSSQKFFEVYIQVSQVLFLRLVNLIELLILFL